MPAFQLYQSFAHRQSGGTTAGGVAMDLLSDTLKLALLTSSHTPALASHTVYADVSANEITGTGYTAGGVTLASKTMISSTANAFATARENSTAYAVGRIVRPATGNGFLYRCIVAGTSGASIPTFATIIGQSFADGTAEWANVGIGAATFDVADVTWAASTIAARYAIVYDDTIADKPLIALLDFGATIASTASTFTVAITDVFTATVS